MQEDSYIRLNTIAEVNKQLSLLSISLIKRMRLDLTAIVDDDDIATMDKLEDKNEVAHLSLRRWIAHARTLRLSTRPRPPRNADGSRPRLFNRISKSSEMPSFVYNLSVNVDAIAGKLVNEALVPLFRQLHPEKDGWDLSLVNLCATNMVLTAAETKDGAGRDIGRMFRRQNDVLKDWKLKDLDAPLQTSSNLGIQESSETPALNKQAVDARSGSEDMHVATQDSFIPEDGWNDEEDDAVHGDSCPVCGATMPSFAIVAHHRFVSSIVIL